MQSDSSHKFLHRLPLYLACYALWLGLAALGMWLIFQLRAAMFDLAVAFRFNPWQVRAIDQFSTVAFGLVWLIGILLLEYWLRQGMRKGRLWWRAGRVLVIEAVALALCYVVQALFG